jgi:hypothetical protein
MSLAIICSQGGSARAQEGLCGVAPSLPTTAQQEETLKGQLQGQADFLSKLIGKAELGGQIETARKQLYQNSDSFFAAQKDAYIAYVFCVLVTGDKSLSMADKLRTLQTFRDAAPRQQSEPAQKGPAPRIVITDFIIKEEGPEQDGVLVRVAHFTIYNDGDAAADDCHIIWDPLTTKAPLGVPTGSPPFGIPPKQSISGNMMGYMSTKFVDKDFKFVGESAAQVTCSGDISSRQLKQAVDYKR